MKDQNEIKNEEMKIPGIARDFSTYTLGKDLDGNVVTVKELQKVLLDMVVEIDRICRKNNIPYALAFGSALGIQNFGGFIPWDDDIDIAIDYFDIPRLVEALKNDLSDEYYFDCYENDKKYNVLIPTIKVRKKNSYIREVNSFRLPNRCEGDGIYVDIVAFMGVPKNRFKHYMHLCWTKALVAPYFLLDSLLRIHPYGLKKAIKKHEAKLANKYKDSDFIGQTFAIPFQNWGAPMKALVYPKDVIYPFKEYEFEGHKFYSFANVYEFCKIKFGEKGFNVWDGEKWVNKFPNYRKNPKHFRKFSLSRKK